MDKGYIYHDSQNLYYREPFGAVILGTKVNLCLELKDDGEVFVELIRFDGRRETIPMTCSSYSKDSKSNKFIATIETNNNLGLTEYYFRIVKGDSTLFYGNNDERLGGVGRTYYNDPKPYQITVHKEYNIPNWYKEGIIYQIFVDRFFNGNDDEKVNNPKVNSVIYGNWYDSPTYIRDLDGKIARWDFYGGNLKGIKKKLLYIKSLGVNIIYMNPIFEAVSCHKYDTGDYEKVDEMFGTNDDFKELCEEAMKSGIRIILDGVFSHTGSDSKYFNRYGHYDSLGAYESKSSPYYNWYKFYQYPDKYECWWGFDNQPNVEELNEDYTNYIIKNRDSIVGKWMELGASGWRLDVADELPDEFIKMIKARMKEIKNDSVLIGEVWEDASNKISYSKRRQYFYGDELDSVTNYPLRDIIISFVKTEIDSTFFIRKFMSLYENYPKESFFACMNLIGNHDTERILTKLNEKFELLKMATFIQMVLPGVPLIYYGDEVGVTGGKDPDNRKAYPWNREDKEILDWYKILGNIRNKYEALTKGDIVFEKNIDSHILCFKRIYNNSRAIIICNSSNDTLDCNLKNIKGNFKDVLNMNSQYFFNEEEMKISISSHECKMLVNIIE